MRSVWKTSKHVAVTVLGIATKAPRQRNSLISVRDRRNGNTYVVGFCFFWFCFLPTSKKKHKKKVAVGGNRTRAVMIFFFFLAESTEACIQNGER
jgi:hypothetical protein